MKDLKITKYGDFEIATSVGKTEFVSWAKMGRIQSDCPIKEPGNHVWFNFGKTREEALKNILIELGISENIEQ